MTRFVTVETNWRVRHVTKDHWGWSFVRGVTILANVTKVSVIILLLPITVLLMIAASRVGCIVICTTEILFISAIIVCL
jgi:hypothetical protein